MAIRLRHINGRLIALCAAKSMPLPDDIYLDDAAHGALAEKFARDWNEMWGLDIPYDTGVDTLIDAEEANNPNREAWDEWQSRQLAESEMAFRDHEFVFHRNDADWSPAPPEGYIALSDAEIEAAEAEDMEFRRCGECGQVECECED